MTHGKPRLADVEIIPFTGAMPVASSGETQIVLKTDSQLLSFECRCNVTEETFVSMHADGSWFSLEIHSPSKLKGQHRGYHGHSA